LKKQLAKWKKKIIENELKKDQQSLSLEKKCYEQLQ